MGLGAAMRNLPMLIILAMNYAAAVIALQAAGLWIDPR